MTRNVATALIGIWLCFFISICSFVNDTRNLHIYCDLEANYNPCPQGYGCEKTENSKDSNLGECIKSCTSHIKRLYDKDHDGYPSLDIEKELVCKDYCRNSLCDCDDTNQFAYGRESPDICDGVDNNCDGHIDETFDKDRDGYYDCTQDRCNAIYNPQNRCDCNDLDPTATIMSQEICDGKDNDCDGQIDNGNICDTGKVCAIVDNSWKCIEQNCIRDSDCETQPSVCVKGVCYPQKDALGEVCDVDRQCENLGLHCLPLNAGISTLNSEKICTKPCCNHANCSELSGFCLKVNISMGICIPISWLSENLGTMSDLEGPCGDMDDWDDIKGSLCQSGYCTKYLGFNSLPLRKCVSTCCNDEDCNGNVCKIIYDEFWEWSLDIINITSITTNPEYPQDFQVGTNNIINPLFTACVDNNTSSDLDYKPCCATRQCNGYGICNIHQDNPFSDYFPVVCTQSPSYPQYTFCCNDSDCNVNSGEACLPENIGFQYVWICKTPQ